MRRGLATALCVVVLVGVGGVAAAAHGPAPAAAARKTALLLGDSLTTETFPDFHAPKGWRLEDFAFPGFAPCDWLTRPKPNFYTRMAAHPAAVIIETAGNDSTSCMKVDGALPVQGSSAFIARYESSLATIFSVARRDGAIVVVLSPPPLLEPGLGAALTKVLLWAHYTEHVDVSTAPRLAVALHGEFVLYLPCLPTETAAMGCVGGQIPVRMVDASYHLHFCPYAADITPVFTCAVYSSGQERWAAATMSVLAGLP